MLPIISFIVLAVICGSVADHAEKRGKTFATMLFVCCALACAGFALYSGLLWAIELKG